MSRRHHSHGIQRLREFDQRYYLPLLLGIIATIAVLGLWQHLLKYEQLHTQQLVQQEAHAIEVELSGELSTRILALEQMASRWQVNGGTPKVAWEADAAQYVEDFGGFQAIEWVDPSFHVRWIVPAKGNEAVQDLDLNQDPHQQNALRIARELHQPFLTHTISLIQGGKGFAANIPLFIGQRFDGFIVGVFWESALFDSILSIPEGYHLHIYDHGELLYNSGSTRQTRFLSSVTIEAYGVDWQVDVFPTPALVAQKQSLLPAVVLWGGLAIVWTLMLTVALRQKATRQIQQIRLINQQLQTEIGHRQQIETSLRQSEERWQLALRGSNDGIWDWNVKTNDVFFSSRWQEMLGFEEGEISGRLEEWSRRVHPDDLAWVTEAVFDHFSQKTPFYSVEHRVQCKDGSYKWILARGQALWDEAGNAVRMVGSHTDITERKQSEIALQESEARYQQLVSHMNAGFVVHAPDTHILQCNTTACELLGLSMEQMMGTVAIDPAWHFVREDGTPMPLEEYPVNLVLSTQAALSNYILGIQRGEQSRVWVLVTAFPEFAANRQIQQVVVTFIDISPLKQVERNLQAMTAAMENALSGISRLDSQGRYLYVNKAYADFVGYQPEEMVGMDWQQTVYPDDLEFLRDAYQRMVRDGKVEVEAKGIRRDGSMFYKHLVMIATYNEQQQFVGHYCFVKDISEKSHLEAERKLAETALRDSESTLRSFFNNKAMLMGIVELRDNDILHLSDNQTAATFFGTTPEAMRNRFASEMGVPRSYLQRWIQAYREAEQTQATVHFEYTHADATERRWLAANVCQIANSSSQYSRFSYIVEDVTQRKQTELALENELMRSQMLFSTSIDGIVVMNHQGDVVQTSPSFAQMLGYTVEETLNLNVVDWDAQWTRAELQEIIERNILPPLFETRHRRKDGSLYDVEISYSRAEVDGEMMHFCICRDISERKRNEAERKQSEALLKFSQARYEALVTNMPGMVYRYFPSTVDTPHHFTFVSPYSYELLELAPEVIVQDANAFVNLIHPEDLPSFLSSVTYAVEHFLSWHWEGRIIVPSGQMKWMEGNSQAQLTTEGAAWDGILVDISDRKRTEIALQNSQARFAGILEIASDAIISVDTNQHITLFNQGAERIFGYAAAEVLGQPLALLMPDRFAQAHHHHVDHYAQGESNTRQMAQRGAIFGRRKDGTEFPAEASISKLNVDGEITFTTFLRDISERVRLEAASQQAEQALRESEARFQSFMNHSPAPAWISDSEGKIFYLSQAYISTFQIPDGDFIGRSIFDLFPADIAQLLLDNIQTVARTQQALEAVEVAPRRDGSMGTFLVYKFPMSNSSGQRLVGGVAIDITQQQQAEEALRQSEATKQAIIQAIPDLLIWMRADGSYIEFISNSHFNIFNPTRQREHVNLCDVLPLDLAQLRMHYTQQALQSSTVQVYEHEILIDGNPCYEEVRIVPLATDEVLVMVRDITDRKQSEIALQLSQERLQLALEASGDGLWDWNIATGEVYYSPQYMTMLGYDIDELPQNFETWEYLTHPDDKSWILDTLNAHFKDSLRQYSFDYRVWTKSGDWKWVADYGKVVARDAQGKPLRMIGTHHDISDRKQKETALQQAMEAAEAANLAKSMFLANMSHELRTPLNVILGFTQVMLHDSSLTPNQLDDLQTIQRSGDYLLSLINDVLDLSKIEAGHFTLEESGFDLIALLHTLRTMMTERAQAKHLQLTFDITPEVPQFIIADEQKLRQVLLNLLSNAIKFTKRGSVTLRVTSWESSPKTCLVSNTAQPNAAPNHLISNAACTLQFEVVDTGVGIAAPEQESIFDAFTQAEAGRKSMSGTGLGLAISRKLLELMNGSISVESTPGVGSTFTVTVPVCPTSGVDRQAEQPERSIIGLVPGQSHRRILVVDDQLENRKLLVRLLTHLGLDVQEATNGQEAIDLWQHWNPDLTWMDIRMPVLDGYEATKQIRAMEQDRASIIIALTAQASQSDRALALAAGCNDYISKPFREETLLLKLREYLGLEYLYADSNPLPSDSSNSLLDTTTNHLSSFDPMIFAQMPADWLETLEDLALCGNDKAIVDLVNQLAPEFNTFKTQLLDLANRFEFEQIVHLIHRNSSA